MKHSLRACIKNTAKTTVICTMIMLTACSTVPANNGQFPSSSDKKMVCNLSAAAICENANYNSDNFNAEILANKDNDGNGEKKSSESTLGQKIVGYTALGLAIVLYTGLLILDNNVRSHPHR